METTAEPAALAPAANASASAGPESRMSWASTIRSASSPVSRSISTKAVPSARATVSFELFRHDAAHVVRLDDAGQIRHWAHSSS